MHLPKDRSQANVTEEGRVSSRNAAVSFDLLVANSRYDTSEHKRLLCTSPGSPLGQTRGRRVSPQSRAAARAPGPWPPVQPLPVTGGAFQGPEATEDPTPVTPPEHRCRHLCLRLRGGTATPKRLGPSPATCQLHGCVCDTPLGLYSRTRSPRRRGHPDGLLRPCAETTRGLSWVQGKLCCLFQRKALAVVATDTYVQV